MSIRVVTAFLVLAVSGAALAQSGQAGQAGQAAAPQGAATGAQQPLPPNDRNKLSYAIGFDIGRDFKENKIDVDLETVIRALRDGFAQRQPAVAEDEMRREVAIMRERMLREARARFEQAARENKARSDRFLAENRTKNGVRTLPSGIQYRVIEEGNGPRATATSEVTVHYRGSLISGLEFDSSFARGEPVTFKVNEMIPGWQEILPMMRVGDEWKVFLPPEKAYGERGQGPIGPNEALIFDIRLVAVK
jgi:FKBP-type peptidyl-prolyl cis-trans isomerase